MLGIRVVCTFAVLVSFSVFANKQKEADQHYAKKNWNDAIVSYHTLLKKDDSNAKNWFRLGRSLHQIEQLDRALYAYEKAEKKGFKALGRLKFHTARIYAKKNNKRKALATLKKMTSYGGPHSKTLESTKEFAGLLGDDDFQVILKQLQPCHSGKFREFDFWLGDWKVKAAGSNVFTAKSKISKQQDGCVILEEYDTGAFAGMSLNFYDPIQKKWHQTWMSNTSSVIYLEGGLNEEGHMVLTDKGMPTSMINKVVNTVTWSLNDNGTVRQHWIQSSDNGQSWNTVFDGIYESVKKGE